MTWMDIDAATAVDVMGIARKLVGTPRSHPIAGTVRISHERTTTRIERTNMSDSVRGFFPGRSAWPTWGPYVVDAAAFGTAVGKRGTVRVAPNPEGTALVFASENGSTTVPVSSVEWPGDDRNVYTNVATITGPELQRVASVADVARRYTDTREILGATFIDADGTVVATDTYRLHGTRIADVSRSSLVDGTVLHVATSSADGDVCIGATETDGIGRTLVEWTSTRGPKKSPRTVHYVATNYRPEGPYPNYAAIMPEERPGDVLGSWTVRDAAGTADVLRTFRPSGSVPVLFASAGSAISATVSENGTERSAILPIGPDVAGEDMAANPGYIRDAILHVGNGARVATFGGLRPFHFVADDPSETFALVMPMRVG